MFYPVQTADELMFSCVDERRLSEIASDWEDAESVIVHEDGSDDVVYEGFTCLKYIVRENDNRIRLMLAKGGNA